MGDSKKNDMGDEVVSCSHFYVCSAANYLLSIISFMVFLYWFISFYILYFGTVYISCKGYL